MNSLIDIISEFDSPSHSYIVGLFGSKILFPLDITHHWFVVKHKNEIRRVEVLGLLSNTIQEGNKAGLTYSQEDLFEGLHRNLFKYLSPLTLSSYILSSRFETFNSGIVKGNKGSLAHKLSEFILHKSWEYPFLDRYEPFPSEGPNSNTYISWVLERVSKSKQKLILPSTAHGKDYHLIQREEYAIAAE
ncbi:MAG: DUF3750 domain-containing protein [Candidatus Woesearchaeota archaeon]